MKKINVYLLLSALLLLTALYFIWNASFSQEGSMVEISIDNEILGQYPLNQDLELALCADKRVCEADETNAGDVTNFLSVKDGRADMTQADCPDRLCVNMPSISHKGETIVCLPNKVVVTIK